MGDRSPKEVHKKAVQKHLKDDDAQHTKELLTETLHYPPSGHTANPSHPTTSDEPGEIKKD